MAWGKLISLRYHGEVRRNMFIALSGGVTEIPTSVDDPSALFHSNFQISHLSLFLIQMLHRTDTSFSFLCFTSCFTWILPQKYSYFIQIAPDTFFSCYSCSFCDPAFNLILDRDHNLARTSEATFRNWEQSKEGTSKDSSPPPSPLTALFKVSDKVYLTLEIALPKDVSVLSQLM